MEKYLRKLLVPQPPHPQHKQNSELVKKIMEKIKFAPDKEMLRLAYFAGCILMYGADKNLSGARDMHAPFLKSDESLGVVVVSVKILKTSGWLEEVSVSKLKVEFTNVEADVESARENGVENLWASEERDPNYSLVTVCSTPQPKMKSGGSSLMQNRFSIKPTNPRISSNIPYHPSGLGLLKGDEKHPFGLGFNPMKQTIEFAASMVKEKNYRAAFRAYWKVLLTPQVSSSKDKVEFLIKALSRCQLHVPVLLELSHEELQAGDDVHRDIVSVSSLTPAQRESYHHFLHLLRCSMRPHTPQYAEANARYYVEGDCFDKPHKLPRFFSWVVPGFLAGLSIPRNRQDILALECLGVVLLVTLVEESPLPAEWFTGTKIRNVFYPVRNYHSPTVEEVDAFFKEVDDIGSKSSEGGRPPGIAVHCGGGVGRAGTILACYLVRHGPAVAKPFCEACKRTASRLNRAVRSADCQGECANTEPPKMTAAEAIQLLRVGRPGSLETEWQEEFVKKYTGILWSRFSSPGEEDRDYSGDVAEKDLPLSMSGKPVDTPSFVVLVGLPGSGKSWFADELVAKSDNGWTRICQDVLGSKDACMNAVSTNCKRIGKGNAPRVILDRCNPTAAERKEWLQLAFKPRDAVAVYFSASVETCKGRISSRFGHETLRAGGGKYALADMAKRMEPPTLGEGFAAVYCVHSFENAASLVEKWTKKKDTGQVEELHAADVKKDKVKQVKTDKHTSEDHRQSASHGASTSQSFDETKIIKFPRTEHLFDTGGKSVSPDDLVADTARAMEMMVNLRPDESLHLEEKIDGGNMGFSLGPDYSVWTQNRSHYIASKEQKQYGMLDNWLLEHNSRLLWILGVQPGERILYGEWMVAKHSLHYTRLPDYFIAFDILDVEKDNFYSRARFNDILDEANALEVDEPIIYRVPIIAKDEKTVLNTKDKWMKLLKSLNSAYRGGPVEGIYIRIDDGDWLKERMKLVRPDFVPGAENWSKDRIIKNIVQRT